MPAASARTRGRASSSTPAGDEQPEQHHRHLVGEPEVDPGRGVAQHAPRSPRTARAPRPRRPRPRSAPAGAAPPPPRTGARRAALTRRRPAARAARARSAIAARQASAPLSSPRPGRRRGPAPARRVSQVSTPLPTGVPSSSATRVSPAVTASQTYSKCGVPPRITTPSATTASWPRASSWQTTGSSTVPGTRTTVGCSTPALPAWPAPAPAARPRSRRASWSRPPRAADPEPSGISCWSGRPRRSSRLLRYRATNSARPRRTRPGRAGRGPSGRAWCAGSAGSPGWRGPAAGPAR